MKQDEKGFIEIIDRKKEIYKNIKGETIAPQKIENHFRNFDLVKQVFLVGDFKPFNTVLIYPNYDSELFKENKYSKEELYEIFSSIVETVNKFLAPYERILDFRITERPFSAEHGELTPKGTYKRRVIVKNFKALIQTMYEKQYISLSIDGIEIKIPNWFLREKGKLSGDVIYENNYIKLKNEENVLFVEKIENEIFRIGDFVYRIEGSKIDLQPFLTNPIYWIGNKNLFDFCGETIFQWYRNREPEKNIEFISSLKIIEEAEEYYAKLKEIHVGGEKSLYGLNIAVMLLQSFKEEYQVNAVNYLRFLTSDKALPVYKIVKDILGRPKITAFVNVRRKLLQTAIRVYENDELADLLKKYFDVNHDILNSEIIATLVEQRTKDFYKTVEKIIANVVEQAEHKELDETPAPSLFEFLEKLVERHPTCYLQMRRILIQYKLQSHDERIRSAASQAREKIRLSFRKWLGQNQTLAYDVETGEEYAWDNVLIFEEMIDEEDKRRMKDAIIQTPLVREAIFFFSNGVLIRLDDILPGGIWISFLRKFPTRAEYRVTVQTRFHGAFNFTINVNKTLSKERLNLESDWLVLASAKVSGQVLTDKFGGYWEKSEVWTKEYNPNETVGHYMERMSKRTDEKTKEILYNIWGFFVWNATTAIVNFAKMTKYAYRLENTSLDNFIIPKHDYQTGTRIVSIEERARFVNEAELIIHFFNNFIIQSLEKYPFLERASIANYIYSGIISALGEEEGIAFLNKFKAGISCSEILNEKEKQIVLEKLDEFLEIVNAGGFIPKRLYFATKRFRRWKKLNPDASLEAQAEMLNELYSTYRLDDLEKEYPEVRAKFYYETCFDESSEELKSELKNIIKLQHEQKIKRKDTLLLLSEIKSKFDLNEKEKYFLARISYSHLKPQDEAEISQIAADGVVKENLVVQFFDNDGNPFIIRRPVSPKEISRLHRLFLDANLMVNFRSEHQFLVAVSQRGFIIGGLFYRVLDSKTVYMDKIVVSNAYRRKGISDILMKEFFNRMKNENYEYVTTGFFRPEYFYKFGFVVERKYSGLAKKL